MNQRLLLHKEKVKACREGMLIREGYWNYGIAVNPEIIARITSPTLQRERKAIIEDFLKLSIRGVKARTELAVTGLATGQQKGPIRGLSQIYEDCFFTRSFHLNHIDSKRMDAIIKVLCSLPQEDYWDLSPANTGVNFHFHLPKASVLGSALVDIPFAQRLNIIFLSPQLEEMSKARIEHVISHELSHVLEKHNRRDKSKEVKEAEANKKAAKWGYPWH